MCIQSHSYIDDGEEAIKLLHNLSQNKQCGHIKALIQLSCNLTEGTFQLGSEHFPPLYPNGPTMRQTFFFCFGLTQLC